MEIEIWDNLQMQNYIDKKLVSTMAENHGQRYFRGFTFFGPDFIESRPAFDSGQCPFELQDLNSFKEDRHVVALEDSDLVGLFSLMFGFFHYEFPHYYRRIFEVREDKRDQKIATSLVRRLKEPCFLHGKVLMIRESSYTADGNKYLKKVIDRELKDAPFRVCDGWFNSLAMYDFGKV